MVERHKISEEELRELIGDPEEVYKGLREFQKSARKLSAQEKEIMELYPEQWIGFVRGRVEANAPTREAVLRELDAKGVDRADVILQFITRKPRIHIH